MNRGFQVPVPCGFQLWQLLDSALSWVYGMETPRPLGRARGVSAFCAVHSSQDDGIDHGHGNLRCRKKLAWKRLGVNAHRWAGCKVSPAGSSGATARSHAVSAGPNSTGVVDVGAAVVDWGHVREYGRAEARRQREARKVHNARSKGGRNSAKARAPCPDLDDEILCRYLVGDYTTQEGLAGAVGVSRWRVRDCLHRYGIHWERKARKGAKRKAVRAGVADYAALGRAGGQKSVAARREHLKPFDAEVRELDGRGLSQEGIARALTRRGGFGEVKRGKVQRALNRIRSG